MASPLGQKRMRWMTGASARVWSVPAFLEFVHPPLTVDAVEAAERQLGVKLPRTYVALLQVQNGGYTDVTLAQSVQSQIWGIGSKYPTILDGSLKQRCADYVDKVWLPTNPDALIPFDGDGHWYLCFDFRAAGPRAEPPIAYVDLEGETEGQVAASFGAFLGLLEPDFGDHLLVGLTQTSTKEAATILESGLGVVFSEPDDFAHGYPIRSAKFRDGDPPDWIWIAPNMVPLGFSRGANRDIHATPGTALRFPDQPNIETVITCSDGAAEAVVAALQSAGCAPLPIHTP
jgi:hypothetical protein